MISIDKRLLAVVLVVVGGLAIFVGRFILDDNESPLPKFPLSQEGQQGSPSNPKASGHSELPALQIVTRVPLTRKFQMVLKPDLPDKLSM